MADFQPQRKIIHVDMDAFYASVEQLDNPELRGKPLAVGGSARRGVVAAASYEARRFGVRSAMPSARANRLCPGLIFVRPRFERYREVSEQIRRIFHSVTDLVEPLSLDEAYLDVTDNHCGQPSATRLAESLRQRIVEDTGLTASAGVSYNKFLAKIASDLNKPNGQAVILPSQAQAFMRQLPVERFHGIGQATAARMQKLGIATGADLERWPLGRLINAFGKAGQHYHDICRGIDRREVRSHRQRKSVGVEDTFEHDLNTLDALHEQLKALSERVASRCERAGVKGHTVTLKLRYGDFSTLTRSRTLAAAVTQTDQLLLCAQALLEECWQAGRGVRLLGVTLSRLEPRDSGQQSLPLAMQQGPIYR